MEKKSFNTPDETMTPPKMKVEIVEVGGGTIMHAKFEPGWKWSVDLKPVVGTDTCPNHHVLIGLSGHLKVVLNDGSEIEAGPDEVVDVPAGHDAWVVGDEAYVAIDVAGANYPQAD
ncbi:MAG TPA: cupin domain-containing protein [Candidatus Nanoarchaeia archaeon]|nr:cupin domain-containing protein [Candidatus Nanoarchaeia archaeon]